MRSPRRLDAVSRALAVTTSLMKSQLGADLDALSAFNSGLDAGFPPCS